MDHIHIYLSRRRKCTYFNFFRLSISEAKTDSGLRSQLYISRVDRQDSGVYKCQAVNAYGHSDHYIYLSVQGELRGRLRFLIQNIFCIISRWKIGERCYSLVILGRKATTEYWFFLSHFAEVLQNCIVRQSLFDTCSIKYLKFSEKPDSPHSLTVTEILSRAVRLSWSQGFDGNSPLVGYTVQYATLSAQGAIRVNQWDSAHSLNVSVHGAGATQSYIT